MCGAWLLLDNALARVSWNVCLCLRIAWAECVGSGIEVKGKGAHMPLHMGGALRFVAAELKRRLFLLVPF